jgi:hypothetical protein
MFGAVEDVYSEIAANLIRLSFEFFITIDSNATKEKQK